MKVIVDEETEGIYTIPLIVDWGISKICQIKGCSEPTFAICCFDNDETKGNGNLHIGICKTHHFIAKKNDKFKFTVNV